MRDLAYRVGAWPARLYDQKIRENEEGLATTTAAKDGEWPSFVREMFGRMYGYDTEPIDPHDPAAGWAKQLHDAAGDLPEWSMLARHAEGDPMFSAIGAKMVCDALANTLRDEDVPSDESGAAEALTQIREAGHDDKDLEERVMQSIAQAIDLERAIDRKETEIRDAVRVAAAKASAEIEELSSAAAAFGFGCGASGKNDPKEREVAMKAVRTDRKLRKLAKLIGRFRMIAGAKRARVKGKGSEETVGVTFGHSLAAALPQDAALYLDKRTKALAYAKALDGRLLQHERIGMEEIKKSGNGAIVLLIDESGSTEQQLGGGYARIDFERALMVAIMRIAVEEKRTLAVIHFGSHVTSPDVYPDGKISTEEILRHAKHWDGRMTEIVRALDGARNLIDTKRIVENADVVLLTDADSFPSMIDVPAKNMLRSGARLWSFVIASPSANYDVLKAASTELYRVDAEAEMDGAMLRMAEVL